jgi:predicted nucleic acid-binding protein
MICLDASVAAKLILYEEWTDRAWALYRATLGADEPIIAPVLLPWEITNILRRRVRAADAISLARALLLLDDFFQLRIEFHHPAGLHHQALVLADSLGLPAAYDAHYLVLAETFNCPLWTDDRRLIRSVAGRLPFVRWIGEYGGSG